MSPTPILDLEQDPPPLPSRLRANGIGLLVGGVLGVFLANQPPDINVALLFPALFLSIAVHELGHLVAGRLAASSSSIASSWRRSAPVRASARMQPMRASRWNGRPN